MEFYGNLGLLQSVDDAHAVALLKRARLYTSGRSPWLVEG